MPKTSSTPAPATSSLPGVPKHFASGRWVAQFDCGMDRPQIARVRDAYQDSGAEGQFLLDLIFFKHTGERLGRISPASGGPRGFEPACPSSRWEPITKPDFERLNQSDARYRWGHLLERLTVTATSADNVIAGGAVYPGHAITIAYVIARTFPSLPAARARDGDYPAALVHQSVPGAGGCVYAGLDLLARARDVGVDEALAFGDQTWLAETDTAYRKVRDEGQRQADLIKPSLRLLLAQWPLTGAVAPPDETACEVVA